MSASEIINNLLMLLNENPNSFSKNIGLERSQAIYDIINGKTERISKNMADKITSAYPKVNKNWLLTGAGDILLEPPKKENTKDIGEIEYPLEPGDTPFIKLAEGQYLMVMPLVPEYSYAGYLSGYSDPQYFEELPKHTIVVTKYHRGQYRAFENVGDSMDDNTKESIPDGAIITAREIKKEHWTSKFHTHRFKDYVIVHKTEGIVTKRIIHHDTKQGFITCMSLNPDKETYPNFDLMLDDVRQIFNVVNVSIPR